MIADDIRELLRREPFEPFRLVLSSGKEYDVVDPDLVVVMKSQLFVAFGGDRWTLIPWLHITAVEAAANGRGHKPARRKRRR